MFAVAAIVAIAVGTFARGVFGPDWFFNADNLADSLPLALPFLVAAGVMLGMNRWSPGRTWFVIGAWLLALHGALGVLLALQLASIMSDGAFSVPAPWPAAQGWVNGAAQALGFGALAVGMWRAPADGWRRRARWAALIIGVATALTVAGLMYVNLAALVVTHALTPEWVLIVVLGGLFVAAAGAFAVACLRAAPRSMPFPELLIAAGAVIYGLNRGLAWWLFGVVPPDSALVWLTDSSIANAALLAVAVGFGSAAFFGEPPEVDRVSA
jgi:hypothetical protein